MSHHEDLSNCDDATMLDFLSDLLLSQVLQDVTLELLHDSDMILQEAGALEWILELQDESSDHSKGLTSNLRLVVLHQS